MLFQTSMTYLIMRNTKEDILCNQNKCGSYRLLIFSLSVFTSLYEGWEDVISEEELGEKWKSITDAIGD